MTNFANQLERQIALAFTQFTVMLSALALIFTSLAACLLVPALTGKPAALGATKSASKDKVANKPDQTPEPLPLAGTTVLVDPGHGGTDPGAISGGVSEKDIVLDVSLKLAEKLEELGADVEMTRADDTFITLPGRLDESNKLCPDLFISVHGNSVKKPDISGIETYYYDDRDKALSQSVLDHVAAELGEQPRWSHARNLFVLDGNAAPATLVEIGYLTNPRTRDLLKTPTYQDKVATALAQAVASYLTAPGALRGCPA
ncbi:MAG: N-acetylmuramoyl-L-alanine amidase [Candidatus Obscuribacter sp.]|nr:N-acetylmuramoyl-L-alanine amidase [Candidatus Obscuribacter sp.]